MDACHPSRQSCGHILCRCIHHRQHATVCGTCRPSHPSCGHIICSYSIHHRQHDTACDTNADTDAHVKPEIASRDIHPKTDTGFKCQSLPACPAKELKTAPLICAREGCDTRVHVHPECSVLVMGEQETDTAVRYRVCLFCHNNLSSPAVAKQHLVAFLTSLATLIPTTSTFKSCSLMTKCFLHAREMVG